MKIEKHFQGLQLSPKPSLCERGGAKKVVCVKWSVNCQLVIGVEEKAIEIGGRVEISYRDRRRCPLKEQKPPPAGSGRLCRSLSAFIYTIPDNAAAHARCLPPPPPSTDGGNKEAKNGNPDWCVALLWHFVTEQSRIL